MDSSRDRDLYLLHERMHDSTLEDWQRKAAGRKLESIKLQMKDSKLNELRHRLVRATVAGDITHVERIGEEIKAYTRDKKYDR